MKKSVSQTTEQNPASKAAPSIIPDSPWTEGDLSIRTGNCNVLLIAPHGHPKNDEKTCDITRLAADELLSYAIVNKTYRKPFRKKGSKRPAQPNKSDKEINLNRQNQVQAHLESDFEKPLLNIVEEIIREFGKALVLWIHGIGDGNLIPENSEENSQDIDALIGIGQGQPNRLTAYKKTINRMSSALKTDPHNPLKAALASIGSHYCGQHENIMNQYFRNKGYSKQKVESIQIEIGKNGFRETGNFQGTAMALANSLIGIALRSDTESEQTALDSADQKDSMPQIQVSAIDLENEQFMSRLNDITSEKIEFRRLVDSIKRHGILNPIIVRRRSDTDGKPYQLISGFRRITALRASLHRKDLAAATIPARVLDDSVSDDEAYQISFTENLARQDLSLWEIAQACAEIKKQKMAEGNMNQGQIDEHLAELIHKDTRTVRRYLKLSSIVNETLTKALHTSEISPTMALDLGKRDLESDEIESLLDHIKAHPKTTRTFERFYSNLERCCQLSGLSVSEVLNCSNSDKFLSLLQNELINRIEYLVDTHKKLTIPEILQGKAGSLAKEIAQVKAGVGRALQNQRFQKKNAALVKKVTAAFEHSDIDGQFKIKPVTNSSGKHVSVTITAPENQIWQAIDAISDLKAQTASIGSARGHKKPKALLSKNDSPPSKEKDKASATNGDQPRFEGEFEL